MPSTRVITASTAVSRQNRKRRLQGLAITGSPRATVMGTPITVTTSTTAPLSPKTTQWPSDQTATANWDPVAQFWGGWLARATNRVKPRSTTSDPGTATNPASTTGFDDTISGMSFMTDATDPTLMVNTSNTLPFRFKVNGVYVSLTGTVAAATGDSYITLDLSSYTAPIRVDVEGANSWAIQRILTKATESVWAPKDGAPAIMVGGDSDSVGPVSGQYASPTPINQDGWVRCFANCLNINDVWASAIGGTGWEQPNSTKPALKTRPYDLLNLMPDGVTYKSSWRPDLIIIMMGINDVSAGHSTATVQADMDTVYNYIRARDATIPILIIGCQWRPTGNLANTQAMDTAMGSKVSSWAVSDPMVGFVSATSSSYSWCTGTGYQGATNSSGNSDVDRGTDGTHPSYVGHAKLGYRVACAVVDFVKSLNV